MCKAVRRAPRTANALAARRVDRKRLGGEGEDVEVSLGAKAECDPRQFSAGLPRALLLGVRGGRAGAEA